MRKNLLQTDTIKMDVDHYVFSVGFIFSLYSYSILKLNSGVSRDRNMNVTHVQLCCNMKLFFCSRMKHLLKLKFQQMNSCLRMAK
jgi:hypothetical protein